MANEIIDNLTPDYVVANGRQRKQINLDTLSPVTLAATQILIIADFSDREAEAIAVSGVTIVKIDAAGAITAISAADDLSGYKIGYQSAAGDAIGDALAGTLEYWDEI